MEKITHWILITILLLILQLTTERALFAQADTVYPGSRHLNTELLKPGLKQYLVYHHWPQNRKMLLLQYWVRNISIEKKGAVKVFAIRECWYTADSNEYRTFLSLCSVKDFTPLYHAAGGNGKMAAYNWSNTEIKGADTVNGNTRKDFHLAFDHPNFNWHLDIETFEMLPLAIGKIFVINFYDAGLTPPAFVTYKVTGSETLRTLDNRQVACWKLATSGSHNGKSYTQTFWISKKEHELLKEEDEFDGRFRYKVKLPVLTPDVVQWHL
ncbi:MAG TPA: hypothetical protein VIM79_17965 [Niastella sp.]